MRFIPNADLAVARVAIEQLRTFKLNPNAKRGARGKELLDEIERQLDTGELDEETSIRLGNWCNMERPIARAEEQFCVISRKLFGRVLDRQ